MSGPSPGALPQPAEPFAGVVLCGGRSRRMGRDKALVVLGGDALARRVSDALGAAGASPVIAVGGAADALAALGLVVVADRFPDEGPLGGVITALGALDAEVVAVLATDLVQPDPAAVRRVVEARRDADADVAVPILGGRRHVHHAVWHRRCLGTLVEAFTDGERAIKRAIAGLRVLEVDGLVPAFLDDVDDPGDLAEAVQRLAVPPGPDGSVDTAG